MLPISSLAKMEMSLYGGMGLNSNAPSYLNNYMGASKLNSYYNFPSFYGNSQADSTMDYQNYLQNLPTKNNSFGQKIPRNISSNTCSEENTTFQGLTKQEQKAITDFYAKNLEPSESLTGALISGGVMSSIMMNPRIFLHPWNTLTTAFKGDTVEMFKDLRKSGPLNDFWKKNHYILEEAYSQMNRAEARSKWKLGIFRKRYTPEEYKQLKEIMEKAIKSGNVDEVAKATETLRHAYCRNGKVFQGWNWIKNKLGFKGETQSVAKMLQNTDEIAKNTKTLLNYNKMTLKKAFMKGGGWFGLAFAGIELFMNWNKVTTAKEKDKENAKLGIKTNYESKQKTQTITKAIGNALGWCAGETLGIWAGAKWGATIGTALGGLPGTIVGATIGFLGGSIGMWLAGKATKAIVGEDVSNKIEAEKLAKTDDGKIQLLQHTIEKMQDGEKVPPQVQQATMKALSYYA